MELIELEAMEQDHQDILQQSMEAGDTSIEVDYRDTLYEYIREHKDLLVTVTMFGLCLLFDGVSIWL